MCSSCDAPSRIPGARPARIGSDSRTNDRLPVRYGGVAARLAGIPLVIHVLDRIADDYLPPPAVRMTRLILRLLPDAVIANSHATLDTLRLPPGRGAVVARPVVYDAVVGPVLERGVVRGSAS